MTTVRMTEDTKFCDPKPVTHLRGIVIPHPHHRRPLANTIPPTPTSHVSPICANQAHSSRRSTGNRTHSLPHSRAHCRSHRSHATRSSAGSAAGIIPAIVSPVIAISSGRSETPASLYPVIVTVAATASGRISTTGGSEPFNAVS